MNRLIAFGSSPIMASSTIIPYPKIIADRMGMQYDSQAKPLTSNSKIARKILESGPLMATSAMSRRGRGIRIGFIGTGLAQPITGK